MVAKLAIKRRKCFCNYSCGEKKFKIGLFAKLKFSPALFKKTPSFVCLVFKIENK